MHGWKWQWATYAVSSSTSAISSIIKTTTSSVTKPNNSVRNTSGMAEGRLQPAWVPLFQQALCYINLLVYFPFTNRKSARSSLPLFLSPESDTPRRAAVLPLFQIMIAVCVCVCVCFPTGRRCWRLHRFLYSPVKLWKRAPTEPAMGAARCRPHAVLKAQRPSLHLHPSQFDFTLQVYQTAVYR